MMFDVKVSLSEIGKEVYKLDEKTGMIGELRAHTDGSAGIDLRYAGEEDIIIPPNNGREGVPLGIFTEFGTNVICLILPRSGNALKHGITITNSPGLIDSDFRGEYKAIIQNTSSETFHIKKGDRICQALFMQKPSVRIVYSDDLSETARGENGFGHTKK